MKHLLFIDPLDKLVVKKDSSLMLALSLKEKGHQVFLLFEEDFYWTNLNLSQLKVYNFQGKIDATSLYIKEFTILNEQIIPLECDDIIHMRIDPPFDSRYLRYLWMLKAISLKGIRVMNAAQGILLHNEKLHAYEHQHSLPTFIGTGEKPFFNYVNQMIAAEHNSLIFKPLDLYQGMGIEKIDIHHDRLHDFFRKKVSDFKGPVVVQPFLETIADGEVRTLFFRGNELGSILKVPPEGEFLANIARGASFEKCKLTTKQLSMCQEVCNMLAPYGVDFIAFDILGDYLSEVNITCPGLLVEVSHALNCNLAFEIIKQIS